MLDAPFRCHSAALAHVAAVVSELWTKQLGLSRLSAGSGAHCKAPLALEANLFEGIRAPLSACLSLLSGASFLFQHLCWRFTRKLVPGFLVVRILVDPFKQLLTAGLFVLGRLDFLFARHWDLHYEIICRCNPVQSTVSMSR